MKTLSFDTILKNKWDIVYLLSADKLYITSHISKDSIPTFLSRNVTLYVASEGNPTGIIVDNLRSAFRESKQLSEVFRYIDNNSDKELINIPQEESFISHLISFINSNTSATL